MKKFLVLLFMILAIQGFSQPTFYVNKYLRVQKVSGTWQTQIDASGTGVGWQALSTEAYVGTFNSNGISASGSYANPPWITSLDYAKLINRPTTVAGLGLTDPFLYSNGSYNNPNWLNTLDYNKLINKPTSLAALGVTDPVVMSNLSYPNPGFIATLDYSKIINRPTTLAALGVTDPVLLSTNTYANPPWISTLAYNKLIGLPSTFAPSPHGHNVSDLLASGATIGQALIYNGSAWAPGNVASGSGTTNLSIGTRTATTLALNPSNGAGVNVPAADATNAGLATADMFLQYQKSYSNSYLRNAVSGGLYRNIIKVLNDSMAIAKNILIDGANSKATVNFEDRDTALHFSVQLNEANFTGIPQTAVTNLGTDLAAKAPLASPAFTGAPTAPTAAAGTNTTQVATTAYVMSAVGASGGSGLSLEQAATFSAVSTATTKRFILVANDETNTGKGTLYFHKGDSLLRFNTTTIAAPVAGAPTVEKIWKLNYSNQYLGVNSISGWTCLPSVSGPTPTGTVYSNLRDTTNTTSSLGLTVTSGFDGDGSGAPPYDANDNGIFCNHLVYNHYWSWSGTTAEVKLTGLTVGKYYKIGILGNAETFEGVQEKFAVGTTETAIKAVGANYGDLTCPNYYVTNPALLWLNGIQPQPDGSITITCTKTAGTKGVLNAMVIMQSSTP